GGLTTLTRDGSIAQTAVDALGTNAAFTGGLGKLGLSTGDVKQAVAALPDVVSAVQSAGQGDYVGAVSHLADAVGQAPDLVTKGVNAAAAKLPDGGASGIAKSLLGDKDFVRALAADPASRQALPLLAQGKVGDALRGLSQNQAASTAAVRWATWATRRRRPPKWWRRRRRGWRTGSRPPVPAASPARCSRTRPSC